jgi:phospho-2-dehydro-3-deoxyheptonate aldolase
VFGEVEEGRLDSQDHGKSVLAMYMGKTDKQIDCSHGNSSKQFQRQIVVGQDIAS